MDLLLARDQEREETIAQQGETIDDLRDEVNRLSRDLRRVVGDVRELERTRVRIPVIDLTVDEEEMFAAENEEPLMVRVERDETVVPETPRSGTLVEIEEDEVRVVGAAVRAFERLEGLLEPEREERQWDEEADVLVAEGRAPPAYERVAGVPEPVE